jgi:hypothetical protein
MAEAKGRDAHCRAPVKCNGTTTSKLNSSFVNERKSKGGYVHPQHISKRHGDGLLES